MAQIIDWGNLANDLVTKMTAATYTGDDVVFRLTEDFDSKWGGSCWWNI